MFIKKFIGIALLGTTCAFAQSNAADSTKTEPVAKSEITKSIELNRTFLDWGVGYVFDQIPISQSNFKILMSEIDYGYWLSDPNESMRMAASVGLYGFALILPVPKVSAAMYFGKPTNDLQAKIGVGGFYDITVGGHAGVNTELGVLIKNKVDISMVIVPTGLDSKRDYIDFIGLRKDGEVASKPYVVFPYFGIFVKLHY